MILCVIFQVAIAVFPQAAEFAMKRFHLTTDHKTIWALTQVIPSMYNFENKVKIEEIFDNNEASSYEFYVNHYPARMITGGSGRRHLLKRSNSKVTLESSYRDVSVTTTYHLKLRVTADGKKHLTIGDN